MNENDLICPICGEPTNSYMGNYRKDRLCRKHAKELKDGLIEQCEGCGAWHETGKRCKCQIEHTKIDFSKVGEEIKKNKATIIEDNASELTCIICGEPSNGKHFCKSCYYKFKDKVLYLQIKKCSEFVKLDAEYESDFVCDDGHLVKSPYEKIIDNWLYKEDITHAYEIKIDVDKDNDITPDFYIPEYNGIKNIYIEFWGYDETNIKYQRTKEYKMKIYPDLVKRDGITVIYLNKKEVENDTYKKKIKYAEQGKINE